VKPEFQPMLYASDDKIAVLGFSVRVHNALRRAKIETVGNLLLYSEEMLFGVRNMGEKGVAEVLAVLERVELLDPPNDMDGQQVTIDDHSHCAAPSILVDLGPPTEPRHQVIILLQTILNNQMRAGTLHPELRIQGRTLKELVFERTIAEELYETLRGILLEPVSVAQELEALLGPLKPRELIIIRQRYGLSPKTLETIATQIGVTRERVRQLEKNALNRTLLKAKTSPLIKVRSSLLFADDPDISYETWSQKLLETGLLGTWTDEKFAEIAPIEMMVALCQAIRYERDDLVFPHCLEIVIRLYAEGKSATPAKVDLALKRIAPEERRLIRRQMRHSGAASVDWLSQHDKTSLTRAEIVATFETLDYIELGDGWYLQTEEENLPSSRGKGYVFHKTIIKMIQYCGTVPLRDIYFGLEHAQVKTGFPVPPIDVLAILLRHYGYVEVDGCWFWDGELDEALNRGEKLILETITKHNGVVHHNNLARVFVESELSFPTLHATLRRSPLFDKTDQALYKLRGSQPSPVAYLAANASASDISLNVVYQYNLDGTIELRANLGTQALGNGTITSEKLPNLSGTWVASSESGEPREITVTQNEIRGLRHDLEALCFKVGDRVRLVFDTDTRSVTVDRIKDME